MVGMMPDRINPKGLSPPPWKLCPNLIPAILIYAEDLGVNTNINHLTA
jgi:hypothetical protein